MGVFITDDINNTNTMILTFVSKQERIWYFFKIISYLFSIAARYKLTYTLELVWGPEVCNLQNTEFIFRLFSNIKYRTIEWEAMILSVENNKVLFLRTEITKTDICR